MASDWGIVTSGTIGRRTRVGDGWCRHSDPVGFYNRRTLRVREEHTAFFRISHLPGTDIRLEATQDERTRTRSQGSVDPGPGLPPTVAKPGDRPRHGSTRNGLQRLGGC